MSRSSARCWLFYALLYGLVAITAIVVRFVPAGPLAGPLKAPIIAIFAAAGAIGIALRPRAGFPAMSDSQMATSWRFGVPAVIGASFGVLTIIHARVFPSHGPRTPFPVGILVFASGAILLETLLRLFGVTVPTALAAFFGDRARTATFWVAATLTSLYEPWPYISDAISAHALSPAAAAVIVRLFAFNIAAAVLYRKGGFFAALTERWSEYLVWHIVAQSVMKLSG